VRSYTIKGKENIVYDDLSEVPIGMEFLDDWRRGNIGDWVLTDDRCVIQIIRSGKMLSQKRYTTNYIGTCTGTFVISPYVKMTGEKKKNIYSFAGNKSPDESVKERKNLTAQEMAFSKYIASGLPSDESYMKAFGTSSRRYAKTKSATLIKQERIVRAVKQELDEVLDKLGVNLEYLIGGVKILAEEASRDNDRLSAYRMLWDAADVVPKMKTTQITGALFQGFSDKMLGDARRPELEATEVDTE